MWMSVTSVGMVPSVGMYLCNGACGGLSFSSSVLPQLPIKWCKNLAVWALVSFGTV